MAESIWPTVHAERATLAGDMANLDEAAWDTPSLCPDWTVRDVLAHMAATARLSAGGFFKGIVTSGFSIGKMQAKDIARERGASGAETLAHFNEVLTSSKHPPGPTDTWLGEVLVHSEDIRRPLSLTRDYPEAMVARAADFYKGSNVLIGSKKRIAGLKLVATDAEWTTGDGPEVKGPLVALLSAMTGRKGAHAALSGDGVAVLAERS